MAASAATATATTPAAAAGDWTVVRRRGRRKSDAPPTASHPDAPPPLPVTPILWSPADPSLDPARVSRLVARAHAAISRVAASRLYRRLLLPDSSLRSRLGLLGPARLSLLGVGSFESSPAARLQLALAALLHRDFLTGASSADLFDPVLSAAECAAAAALGFSVPSLDDGCRRRVEEPTLFYMPHCEASLYDALLAANWESPAQLRRVCVLGNSFRRYALQAEDNRSGPAAKASHVLAAERFAWEERVDDAGDVDDDDWFARAFNETSWHFFEVDDGVDLAAATAGGRR
ncbi:protein SENSITIVITY TO RED LIGHT REDUCED 1 [Phragmites australis]|uniref:protein SENSITIVITY TO RED LIGHT REDUCED 1 n=1 Tax=Phragmites australis TaxID=29695 RepID=UPI002D776247|nr:protein SENSITIVITY TO RED LIGHT REDUCED 1 [Phragmites australis]